MNPERSAAKMHHVETEIKEKRYAVSEQPAVYTEEARRLDQASKQFDQTTKAVDKVIEKGDQSASKDKDQIQKLESEAKSAAKEFHKEHDKHAKKEAKLQSELEKQEEKTLKVAQKLQKEQEKERQAEAAKANEAMAKEAEARRIAAELAQKREDDRMLVESKVRELALTEQQLKQKVAALAEHQQREVRELEIKQKETNADVETARKGLEALKQRHAQEKAGLNDMQKELRRIQDELETARQLGEKYIKDRDALEKQILALDQKAAVEQKRVQELYILQARLKQGIEQQSHDVALDESALRERQELVKSMEAEKREVEIHAKDQLTNERIALDKARDLAAKTEKERHGQEKDLSRLTREEIEAKQQAQKLATNVSMKVEQKPVSVDVYEHKKMETTEPVVTELNVDVHDEKKSLPEKIVDKVKNIF